MYQPATSPQSIGGVLDSGFRLFGACFTQVFLFAFAVALVSVPFSLAAPFFVGREMTLGVKVEIALAVAAMVVIITIIASGMIARIDGVARGAPLSVGAALRIGARRFLAVLGAGLLTSLAVTAVPALAACAAYFAGSPLVTAIGLFVLLALPFSIVLIWLVFGPYLAITDGLGPVRSLRYSRALTRGHWWRTTALITIMGIILIVLYMVVGVAFAIVVAMNPPSVENIEPPWYLQVIVGPVMQALVVPLSYSLFMATLYDLKLRHEGGDLAARIEASA